MLVFVDCTGIEEMCGWTQREIFYTLRCNSEIYLKSICAVAGLNLNVHLSLIKLTFTLLQVKG